MDQRFRKLLISLAIAISASALALPPSAAEVVPFPGDTHIQNDMVLDANGECTDWVSLTYALLPAETPFALSFDTLPDCTVQVYYIELEGNAFYSAGGATAAWTVGRSNDLHLGFGVVDTTVAWGPTWACPWGISHAARGTYYVSVAYDAEDPDPCAHVWTTYFYSHLNGFWHGRTGGLVGTAGSP